MKMRVIPRRCDFQWCCVCLNFAGIICFNSEFDKMICPLWFCEPKAPRWTSEACSRATKKAVIKKNDRRKNRHYGFSHRKNNERRNPSHARAPQRNPLPLLGPVTSAFAHVPTDQHPIWSDLSVFRVSCSCVFIICLAQTPALPEISLLPIQNVCRNIITICTPTQKTRIQHIFYHFRCLTSTVT